MASRLVGTHNDQTDLLKTLRGGVDHHHTHEKKNGCCNDPDHQHEVEDLLGNDSIEYDPGLEQCCIQEMEDRKRAGKIWSALRKVDPIAQVERRKENAINVIPGIGERKNRLMEWISDNNDNKEENGESLEKPDDGEIDNSDDELDEYLKDFEEEQDVELGNLMQNSVRVSLCKKIHTNGQLASFLIDANQYRMNPKCLLFCSPEDAEDALFSNLCTIFENLANSVDLHAEFGIVNNQVFADTDHPLFKSGCLKDIDIKVSSTPFVLTFIETDPNPKCYFPRAILEKDTSCIQSWCNSLLLNGPSSSSSNQNENSREEEEISFCGKVGCTRKFAHEHIKPNEMSSLNSFN